MVGGRRRRCRGQHNRRLIKLRDATAVRPSPRRAAVAPFIGAGMLSISDLVRSGEATPALRALKATVTHIEESDDDGTPQ